MNHYNIGAVTEEEIMAFAEHVKAELGFQHTFEWSLAQPSICLETRILLRRQLIGEYPWVAKEEVLHEVTHIFVGNGHGGSFFTEYARLVHRFMGTQAEVSDARLHS